MEKIKDANSGDWWLQMGGESVRRIGYWPKKIFKGLSESGNYVACGGEAYGEPAKMGLPEMGFGIRPEFGGGREWPFCWNTNVVNEDKKAVIYDDFEKLENGRPQYLVFYDERDHRAIFGGPRHLA
ncbi:uncharacterized protein LOC141588660 [Silene latifolia]|uniref:uncharacterized protein LOC141588660 n=1 Tax=Silene latifolia TaxID=37657 RepID=UPI003D78A4B8